NFIQADERGSADDVRRVMEHVRSLVATQAGVQLASEVRLIGFEDSLDLAVDVSGPSPPSTSSRGAE
ncbi:MAG: hypothetical protein ACRDV4_10595, partial [Acidimicrobiales bacterium]